MQLDHAQRVKHTQGLCSEQRPQLRLPEQVADEEGRAVRAHREEGLCAPRIRSETLLDRHSRSNYSDLEAERRRVIEPRK